MTVDFISIRKRSIALLEVLIAFTLVTLCALPLIYPHIAIFKAERQFLSVIDLDHAVNLLFANRLEKLYLHEVSWEDVDSGKSFPVDQQLLLESGFKGALPYQGKYQFVEQRHKPEKQPEDAVYLFKLIFEFTPLQKNELNELLENNNTLVYEYEIVIERKPASENP